MQTFGKVPPPPISKVLHHKRNYKMAVPSRTKTYGKGKIDTKIQNLEKKQWFAHCPILQHEKCEQNQNATNLTQFTLFKTITA